jgi:hypothetical protein
VKISLVTLKLTKGLLTGGRCSYSRGPTKREDKNTSRENECYYQRVNQGVTRSSVVGGQGEQSNLCRVSRIVWHRNIFHRHNLLLQNLQLLLRYKRCRTSTATFQGKHCITLSLIMVCWSAPSVSFRVKAPETQNTPWWESNLQLPDYQKVTLSLTLRPTEPSTKQPIKHFWS